VIGAAAYYGSTDVLKLLLGKLNELKIDFPASEKLDTNQKGQL
jgi:hypothetical protein